MSRPLEPSEEYILAAFLSGELPDDLRREIISYLTGHDRARDLLAMAQEALDAAESGDGSSQELPEPARLPLSKGRIERSVAPTEDRNYWKVTALFAGAVLVLTVIVALMAMNTSRLQGLVVDPVWAPVVEGDAMALQWDAVPGATLYHVMGYDNRAGEASIVGMSTIESINLSDLALVEGSTSDRLWILAFDTDGQLLDQSEPVQISMSADTFAQ